MSHLRLIDGGIDGGTLAARLDKALDSELHEALGGIRQNSDLAESINRFLAALDRPRRPSGLFGVDVDDYGLDPVFAARVRPVLRRLFSLSGEAVPSEGAAIIVTPRLGWLLGQLIPNREARPLRDLSTPTLGVALNRLGCVQANQENLRRLVEEGRVVICARDFAKIALQTNTPLIAARWNGLSFELGAPIAPTGTPQALTDRLRYGHANARS